MAVADSGGGGCTVRTRSTAVSDSGGVAGTFDRFRRTRQSCPAPPLPAPAHPLHRHPREGGDPGLSPCEEHRQTGHRPGGRGRQGADREVVASGHRSFLWRPTWIPAFAGMTVFLLCEDGRRRCRTGAAVVGRCGDGRRRWQTAAVVVARCGRDRRRCRTVVGRQAGATFPQNPAVMSGATPARPGTPPPPSSPRRRGSRFVAVRRTATWRAPAGRTA
jgi:hypothetical protein